MCAIGSSVERLNRMVYPAKERENALELTVRTLASKYGILSAYNLGTVV